ADDLLRRVPHRPGGAGVPADDAAAGVEHDDGVVVDALDQQAEALLALAQLLLDPLALGQVARDLREADQLPPRVADGRDDHVGPEAGAVLAQPPPLVLEPPGGPGHLQLVLGPAPADGLLGVEAGEVLADNLLGLVALEALGAGVPGPD